MTRTASERRRTLWLQERLDGVPESLRERVREAVEAQERSGQRPEATLAEAALRLLERVLSGSVHWSGSGAKSRKNRDEQSQRLRSDALDLLAADALLTWACEAAAEAGEDAFASFRTTYGEARLARLAPGGREPR